jgi:hypothetical protein
LIFKVQEWKKIFTDGLSNEKSKKTNVENDTDKIYKDICKQLGMSIHNINLVNDFGTLTTFVDTVKNNWTGAQIDIQFQRLIVDSATEGPLFHSNYDSEKLALLFRLIARHAKYSRPSKQPLRVRTFLKVYMELGS